MIFLNGLLKQGQKNSIFVKKYIMKPFTEETIDTIIKIGGKGTLNHLKSNRIITILLYNRT